jgi:hypothetical protein
MYHDKKIEKRRHEENRLLKLPQIKSFLVVLFFLYLIKFYCDNNVLITANNKTVNRVLFVGILVLLPVKLPPHSRPSIA